MLFEVLKTSYQKERKLKSYQNLNINKLNYAKLKKN